MKTTPQAIRFSSSALVGGRPRCGVSQASSTFLEFCPSHDQSSLNALIRFTRPETGRNGRDLPTSSLNETTRCGAESSSWVCGIRLPRWESPLTGITHIKLPGSKQRTILDESHRSITHGCRQPSNQAHKTISRRGELAAPGSGGGFHHVCTPFKLLRARTSPLVASLHL